MNKKKIINGESIQAGQALVGITSSGPHSNGYSLIRKIIEAKKVDINQAFDGSTLGKKLLAPTQLYIKPILSLIENTTVHGMAHITGGGIMENISRVIPEGLAIEVEQNSWERLPVFDWLQEQGNIDDVEMLRTFNCGIGMVMVVDQADIDTVTSHFADHGLNAWNIGQVIEKTDQDVVLK